MAAGYCGEKTVEDFLERVGKDYPEPRTYVSRRRRFWYKADLDKAIGLSDDADNSPTGMGERFRDKIGKNRDG